MKTTLQDVPVVVAEKKSKHSLVPSTTVSPVYDPSLQEDIQVVMAYNEITDQIKGLVDRQKQLAVVLNEAGLAYVVNHNCEAMSPTEQVASVKLADALLPGQEQVGDPEETMFSMQNAYVKFDAAQATKHLASINKDPNKHIEWKVKAVFDTEVFYVDGKFNEERYTAFTRAVQAIAKKLKVECPLTCSKEIGVVDGFHARRWQNFTAEQNIALQRVIPAKTMLKALRPVAA